MKIETPEEFQKWFLEYRETANFFMATQGKDHAIWLCMRDAFLKGSEPASEPESK